MKVCLDLFCGLGGFSAAFADADDWTVVTVDVAERFDPDLQADVLELRPADVLDALPVDSWDAMDLFVVLASPPCTTFSKACPWQTYWDKDSGRLVPDNERSREHITLALHTVGLVHGLAPDYWYLENPIGRMRDFLGEPTGTVSYCLYGRDYMKPTDLWGHHPESFDYRWCGYDKECHATNTHGGVANTADPYPCDPAERAKVPYDLSESIRHAVENPDPRESIEMWT